MVGAVEVLDEAVVDLVEDVVDLQPRREGAPLHAEGVAAVDRAVASGAPAVAGKAPQKEQDEVLERGPGGEDGLEEVARHPHLVVVLRIKTRAGA